MLLQVVVPGTAGLALLRLALLRLLRSPLGCSSAMPTVASLVGSSSRGLLVGSWRVLLDS